MRAVRMDRFGGPEALRLIDTPTPTPGAGQVLVRVEEAAEAHRALEGRRTTGKVVLVA